MIVIFSIIISSIIIILLPGIMAGSNRSGDLADPQVPSLKSMIIIITIMIMKILGDVDTDENYDDGSLMI